MSEVYKEIFTANTPVEYWMGNKIKLQKDYEDRALSYDKLLHLLMEDVKGSLTDSIRSPMVKGRLKKLETLYRKVLEKSRKQEIKQPFEDIHDILGIRIVVPFLEDIGIAEADIKSSFSVVETKHKRQTLSAKEFGYDSTHLIIDVPERLKSAAGVSDKLHCEIQIRTILQDAWAEVEHELVYKSSINNVESAIRRKLTALNATLSLADISFQEIRDHQRRRIQEIEERHTKILDKVSTVPQKMGGRYEGEELLPTGETDLSDFAINDIFYEALNAHIDNRLSRAVELYSYIITVAPNHYVYNHRGLVYFSLSQYDKALADFNKAIELLPEDTRVYTNRGLTYRMLKDTEKALADFNRSLELNPLWPDTFYGRALAYYDLGDVRSALEDCDRAIAIKPDFKQAVKFKQFILNRDMDDSRMQ